jgi:carboxymethylenebutenolidase
MGWRREFELAPTSYYGVGIEGVLDEAKAITVPLLLHIAAEDALCPPSAQATIHGVLKDIPGVVLDTHAGVGHAFARRGGAPYVPQAAERADATTLMFLGRHLSSGNDARRDISGQPPDPTWKVSAPRSP